MAKNTGNKVVQLAQVYWFNDRNYGRDLSLYDNPQESRNLSVALMSGWWETAPIIVTPMSDEDKAKAVQLLELYHAKLKAVTVDLDYSVTPGQSSIKLSPVEHLHAWEKTYTKNGKVITPEYDAVFGFQRSDSLTGALALRAKHGTKEAYTLPVIVKEYEHLSERVTDCILENTGKIAGAKLTDNHGPSIMRQAFAYNDAIRKDGKAMLEIGTIRVISGGAAPKRGTGQKAHYLCVLDARFPKLDLRKRLADAEHGQDFWKSLDRNRLLELEKGTRLPLPEKTKASDEAEIEAYLARPKDDDTKAAVMAKKVDIEAAPNQTAVNIVKFILRAVMENNLGALNGLEPFADDLNKAFDKTGLWKPAKAASSQELPPVTQGNNPPVL